MQTFRRLTNFPGNLFPVKVRYVLTVWIFHILNSTEVFGSIDWYSSIPKRNSTSLVLRCRHIIAYYNGTQRSIDKGRDSWQTSRIVVSILKSKYFLTYRLIIFNRGAVFEKAIGYLDSPCNDGSFKPRHVAYACVFHKVANFGSSFFPRRISIFRSE